MFGASVLVTIDEWELRGETIRVEFRTTSTYVDVTVNSNATDITEQTTRFSTVGEAERWNVQFARGLLRAGGRRRGRTVVESFGSSAGFRTPGSARHGAFAGAHRSREGHPGASRPGPWPTAGPSQRLSESYQILGVRPGVSERELRAVYRRLALLWHPDRCDDPDAAGHMGAINRAYDQVRRSEGLAS